MIISILTFTIGLAYLIFKYGLQDSVSAYYYKLPSKYNFLFGVWLATFSAPLLFYPSLLLKCSALCVIGVGLAAAYKGDKLINFVHYTFAILAVLFGLFNILFMNVGCGLISTFIVLIFRFLENKNAVLYAEIVAFFIIILSTLFNI